MPALTYSRRDILHIGALGIFADALAVHAASPAASADAVIFIHLKGGPSHLDTLDMKPTAPAEERGEFTPIASRVAGVPVCEHLPKLAAVLDRFCLVRGISHSAGAHPQADEYLFTGNRPNPAFTHPAVGAVALKERPGRADLPGFVAVPTSEMGPGFLGVEFSPFKTTAVPKPGKPFEVRGLSLPAGLTAEQVRHRDRLLADLDTALRGAEKVNPSVAGLDRFGKTAAEMILSPTAREAFDTGKEPTSIVKLFPPSDLGQSLLLAGRLVEHGCRFVAVNHDGWDTHTENFKGHKKLLTELDGALPALVEALRAKGRLGRTLVVAAGEFGRTPTINKQAGRDHWPRASWALFAGGGTAPGLVGGTDAKGHGPDAETKLAPDDLAASVLRALGVDPKTEYHTPTGRPVILVPHGRVIERLFA